MSAGGQSSRTPYNHLRYKYPGTWLKLTEMLDNSGAAVACHPDRGLVGTPGGHRLEGAHDGPCQVARVARGQTSPASSSAISRCQSDPAMLKFLQDEKNTVRTLRLQKNLRRNPFGGWYEGSTVLEKIGGTAHPY
eukprot:CAMPEP_0117511032 /NCGR_PEP_ID=MMETSP0784-20121206/28297_1 /TAXON_ID=39447 /ORGANISM="" /LENGTH=134 /DNA_ID=CAMNT_0005306689 /DNA_START=35 /DNA_END=439 /DNA_ORIENTATION=+